MTAATGIPVAEHAARRARLLEVAANQGLGGFVLFGATPIRYYTGFEFLATERPVALGETIAHLFGVPGLIGKTSFHPRENGIFGAGEGREHQACAHD